jgi:hypothetical protein
MRGRQVFARSSKTDPRADLLALLALVCPVESRAGGGSSTAL